jgi:lysophospholipase L1-like esterase
MSLTMLLRKSVLVLLFLCWRCSATTINICAIGDSLTNGYESNPATNPLAQMVSALNTYTGTSNYVAVDEAVNGTTSPMWGSDTWGSFLATAINAFGAAGGCNVVLYMIGTNDSKSTVATSASVYQQNVALTISYLEQAGYTNIMLNYPPYVDTTTSPWSANSNTLLVSYQQTLSAIAAGDPDVHVGDTKAYAYFEANPALYDSDGVHLTNAGYTYLGGTLWATAYEKLFLPPAVHFVGVGSTEMFEGFAAAAVNDLANAIAIPKKCSVHHWSVRSTTGPGNLAGVEDIRFVPGQIQYGDLWVVWVACGPNLGVTDIWAYLSVNATVAVRDYLAMPRAILLLAPAAQTTAGIDVIPAALYLGPWNVVDDPGLPEAVWTALSGATGQPITAGLSSIRPEDALLLTNRALGMDLNPANLCPPFDTGVAGAGGICTSLPFIYSFSLGYGPGPSGVPIMSAFSSAQISAAAFALPGFPDPVTSALVPPTIQVFAVGEAPILFIVNRSNPNGLGLPIANIPNCLGVNPEPVVCVTGQGAGGYVSDNSYFVRNLWDQHPYPPTGVFPSVTQPAAGYCQPPVPPGRVGFCLVARRPLGSLFSGSLCEGQSSAFSWPLDQALQGVRTLIPVPGNNAPDLNVGNFAVNLIIREPISGAYSTTEFSEVRRFGNTMGNLNLVAGLFGKPAYISQETNVQITLPNNNPLHKPCELGFGEVAGPPEGLRERALSSIEEATAVKNTPDSLGYLFFNFGNASQLARKRNYGYLMVDGVDPLFADYENKTGNPGQPANPNVPLTWGELPTCIAFGAGAPACTNVGIWAGGTSYPNLRNGTYPAWAELRMMCDPATPHCTTGADPNGAEALVQNIQADIHFNRLGGVPDFLPFSDASGGPLSFNPPYGSVTFIRDHYAFVAANEPDEYSNIPPYSNATASTTRQSNVVVDFGGPGTTCPLVNAPIDAPPRSECGGDAGGWIIPVPAGAIPGSGQLQ